MAVSSAVIYATGFELYSRLV